MILNMDTMTNLLAITPAGLLTLLIGIVIVLDIVWPESRRRDIGVIASISLFAIAIITVLIQPPSDPTQQMVLGGMIRFDVMTQIFTTMTFVAAAIAVLISLDVPQIGNRGEYYTVLLVATLGAVIISGGADLISLFLGLETLSVSLYCLAGFLRNSEKSAEAGMKYFLFGAFTSTIMLYGMSLLYGFTGQTNIYAIGTRISELYTTSGGSIEFLFPILVALIMVTAGFGFKVSMVPFHFWTPDVYEGAPTPVTAFISVASKAASFAVLACFFIIVFQGGTITTFWVQVISVLAVVTMTLGNLLALPQKNIKRLLAYSSIAQAGYALIGVAAISSQTQELGAGVAAVTFYMAMYILTNLAGFGVIILFANSTGSEEIKDFAGLGRRNFGLAFVMTVALLSLAGIPPAAGFIGKFFLFQAAVNANLTWLAVIGVLNSIVALYYYLIVIKVMFVDRSEDESKNIPVSQPYVIALGISTLAVVLIGTVLANPLYDWAMAAAKGLGWL